MTTYAYHPVGQLGAGQVASVDGPLTDDTITYTYDEVGRVMTRAINGVGVTWAFDALGRVTSESNVLGMFTYTYDGVTGRLASVGYPNGQSSTYSYFANANDRRLQTIHHKYPNGSTMSKFDYAYDAVGNILTWRQQADNDAVLWEYGYDPADQIVAALKKSTDPTPTILKRYAYAYDPAGNRTVEQIDDQVTGATHDNLNRLVSQQPSGAMVFAGTVSEAATVTVQGTPAVVTPDNQFRASVPVGTGTNTVTVTANDPSGNVGTQQYEVDSFGSGRTFTYDANGNLTSDGTRTFEWDARNQLLAVNVGTHRSEFVYDGLKRRVRIVEKENSVVQLDTTVIWCQTVICEERAADGVTVTRRSFSQGEQSAGTTRFFVGDRLGSLDAVTDTSGTLLARYAFDPWGRRTVTAGTDITNAGYAGHKWQSASSLSLTLYRAYDAELGRWMSEDPAGRADGPNLYLYAVNQPTRRIDPLGDTSQCCSCSVQVKCRPVGGLIGILADHCYIVAKDSQCKTWYIESGQNNGQNEANASETLGKGNSEAWITWTGWTKTADCKVVECMKRSVNNWNDANIGYNPLGPNSNSFASWIMKECGARGGPPLGASAPGWY